MKTGIYYDIMSGRPGEVGDVNNHQAATVGEAVDDFREFLKNCELFGDDYPDARLEMIIKYESGDVQERIYEIGPSGTMGCSSKWDC